MDVANITDEQKCKTIIKICLTTKKVCGLDGILKWGINVYVSSCIFCPLCRNSLCILSPISVKRKHYFYLQPKPTFTLRLRLASVLSFKALSSMHLAPPCSTGTVQGASPPLFTLPLSPSLCIYSFRCWVMMSAGPLSTSLKS